MAGRGTKHRSQPWKYVPRRTAIEQNRRVLDAMANAAQKGLATGDVRGARTQMAQASPSTVGKASGSNILQQVGKRLREARPEAAFEHDKKLVTNALVSKAKGIAGAPITPKPPGSPITKKGFSVTRLAKDVGHYAAAMNPVGNLIEGADILRDKDDARERWAATVSGEKFQDRLGIDTRYMDRLRAQGPAGELASGAIDAVTAPSMLVPGIGPIGGGANLTSKVGARILARKIAAEAAGGAVGNVAARIASEETAKHTDNPWVISGVGLAAGLAGGVGGYAGVDKAGNIARAGNRAAEAGDRALVRRLPAGAQGRSAEAGEFRFIDPGDPLLHGTQTDFDELAVSDKGGQGAAAYVTHNIDTADLDLTKPGRNADVYNGVEWAERNAIPESATGAQTRIETPNRRLKSLLWRKPVGDDEIIQVREALETPEQQAIFDDVVSASRADEADPEVRGYTLRHAVEMAYADEAAEQMNTAVAAAKAAGTEPMAARAEVNRALNTKVSQTLKRAGFDATTIDFTGYAETAIFDPNDLGSYYEYHARAKAAEAAAKPEALEGDVILGREWDQAEEMAKAEELFASNPKAGKLLDGVTNPQEWVTLQRKVFDAALAGAEGRFWYRRSANAILSATRGDVDMAEKLTLLIAAYSPKSEPVPNMNLALRAWNQWQTKGVVEGVGTRSMDRIANRILSGEKLASNSGPKTNSFYTNMIGYIQPEKALDVATVDRHMGTKYGIVPKAGSGGSIQINKSQYQMIEQGLREIGRVLGWTTDQVQAAVWVVEKSQKLNNQALARALKSVETAEKKLLAAPSDKAMANLEAKRAKAAHLDEIAANPASISYDSLVDFADALEERMVQVAWETAPGRSSGVLPGYPNWTLAQKTEFHHALSKIMYDENGDDIVAKMLGLPAGGEFDAMGMYVNPRGQLELNPGTQTRFAVPKAKATTGATATGKGVETGLRNTVDPDARLLINAWASIRGLIYRQEAVPWNTWFDPKNMAEADSQILKMGRTISDTELETLVRSLGKDVVIIPREGIGAAFINISKTLDNKSFEHLVTAKVNDLVKDTDLEVELRRAKHDGDYPDNKWGNQRESDGQGYARRLRDAGRQDVWDWARRVLEPQAHALWTDFGERFGFTDADVIAKQAEEAALRPSGEAGNVAAPLAYQLGMTAGPAAYGYATGDDQEDRWKRALAFGVAGAVGGATVGLAAGGMGGKAKNLPGPTPTPKTSVLTTLPPEAIESTRIISGGRERIIPKLGTAAAEKAIAMKEAVSHAPGRISQALPPVLHRGAALLNPSKTMDLPVLIAWRARGATKVQLLGEFNTQMTPFVEAVETALPGATYIGPPPPARVKGLIGTAKDIFDRPEMYDIPDELRTAIDDYNAASWDFVSGRARAEYGVDVYPYTAQSKEDFAYLPTLARKADVDDKLDSAMAGLSTSRRAKRRGYQTAYDRMMKEADFEPETDLRQLATTLNEAMASNAGDSVFKHGAGGKTQTEVIDELHPGIRKQKVDAMNGMRALQARAKDALQTKARLIRDTQLTETDLRHVEQRHAPIAERVAKLEADNEFGPELSYLSGQQRELEMLRAKLIKAIATKEGKMAFQDVRVDQVTTAIEQARTRVLDTVRAYESAGMQSADGTVKYVQDPATHRWYTPDAAKTIQKLTSAPAGMGKGMFNILDEIRAWHLAGDFSPLTIQGVLGIVTDPLTAWKALRQVNGDPLKVLQKIQDQEFGTVSDFSFATGRRFGLQMPDYYELGAGEGRRGVGRIPGVGRVEDTMFAIIQIMQFNQWKNDRALLQGWNPGMTDVQAGGEAASTLGKFVPGLDPGERGISATRGAVERALVTSSSFLAAPALAAADAGTGYLKLAKSAFVKLSRSNASDPRSAWQTLNGREQLAIRRTFQAAGTVMGLSALSAAASADSRNMSVEDAIKETWDTDSRYFMALQFGEGRSIPIGGPFRSAVKAIMPDRNGVPFGNLPSWAGGKLRSEIKLPLDLHSNKDFDGDAIYEGNIMRPENIMRALWYGSEAMMPIATGEASESIRKQDRPLDETAWAVVSQFAGTNYTPVSPTEKLNSIAREQYEGREFYDLLPKEQDKIKKANPGLWNQAVAKGSDARQQAEAVKAQTKADQEADNELLLKGELALSEWDKGREDRANQLVGANRAIYSDSDFKGKGTNETLQKYYDVIDENTTNGRVDWDAVREWRSTLSDSKNKLIDENSGLSKTDLEKLRSRVQSEYYELPRYRGFTADEAVAIDELWQEVRNNSRSAEAGHMLGTLRKVDTSGYPPEIVTAVRRRIIGGLAEDTSRQKYAREHPEIAIINRQGRLTASDIAAINEAMRK